MRQNLLGDCIREKFFRLLLRCTRFSSDESTKSDCLIFRFALLLLRISIWLWFALFLFILPVPVKLKRLAALRLVFCFGIDYLLFTSQNYSLTTTF